MSTSSQAQQTAAKSLKKPSALSDDNTPETQINNPLSPMHVCGPHCNEPCTICRRCGTECFSEFGLHEHSLSVECNPNYPADGEEGKEDRLQVGPRSPTRVDSTWKSYPFHIAVTESETRDELLRARSIIARNTALKHLILISEEHFTLLETRCSQLKTQSWCHILLDVFPELKGKNGLDGLPVAVTKALLPYYEVAQAVTRGLTDVTGDNLNLTEAETASVHETHVGLLMMNSMLAAILLQKEKREKPEDN